MQAQYFESKDTLSHQSHFICWRSLGAAFLLTILTYIALTAIGAGIGGMIASNLISNEESGAGLATGTGIWLGLSAALSLFIGGFFCLRLARFVTPKVGASHGLVLASLFFLPMIWGLGTGLGSVASGLGKTVLAASNGIANITSNPMVQDTLQRSVGSAQLKSTPKEVMEGLAVRLLQGNTASATSYLAYQTGQSEAEVAQRITQISGEFQANAKLAAESTAKAVATAGWSLFITLLVGMAAAVGGTVLGARLNAQMPIAQPVIDRSGTGQYVTA